MSLVGNNGGLTLGSVAFPVIVVSSPRRWSSGIMALMTSCLRSTTQARSGEGATCDEAPSSHSGE